MAEAFGLEFLPEKKFMEQALRLAEQALSMGEVPVGAVVVLNGKVIGEGHNTREKNKDPLGHAELAAIASACKTVGDWRLTGAALYVTLEPCPMCAGAALNARIGRIVYGADDPMMGACGSAADLLHLKNCGNPGVFRNFMEEECRELLSRFFAELRGKGSPC